MMNWAQAQAKSRPDIGFARAFSASSVLSASLALRPLASIIATAQQAASMKLITPSTTAPANSPNETSGSTRTSHKNGASNARTESAAAPYRMKPRGKVRKRWQGETSMIAVRTRPKAAKTTISPASTT